MGYLITLTVPIVTAAAGLVVGLLTERKGGKHS